MPAEEIVDQAEKVTPDANDWLLIQENSGSQIVKKVKFSNLISAGGGWSFHSEINFEVVQRASRSFSLGSTVSIALVRVGPVFDSVAEYGIKAEELSSLTPDVAAPTPGYLIIIPAFKTGPYVWDKSALDIPTLNAMRTIDVAANGTVTIVSNFAADTVTIPSVDIAFLP